jgi:hypothetical protein
VHGDLSPPLDEATSQEASNAYTLQRCPIVGAMGKVVRWADVTDEQDADPQEADLPGKNLPSVLPT